MNQLSPTITNYNQTITNYPQLIGGKFVASKVRSPRSPGRRAEDERRTSEGSAAVTLKAQDERSSAAETLVNIYIKLYSYYINIHIYIYMVTT